MKTLSVTFTVTVVINFGFSRLLLLCTNVLYGSAVLQMICWWETHASTLAHTSIHSLISRGWGRFLFDAMKKHNFWFIHRKLIDWWAHDKWPLAKLIHQNSCKWFKSPLDSFPYMVHYHLFSFLFSYNACVRECMLCFSSVHSSASCSLISLVSIVLTLVQFMKLALC